MSGVSIRCASRIKVKNKADAMKMTNVVKTRDMHGRQKRPDQRRCKMIIKDETKVASRGSRRDRVAITENKCRMTDFIQLRQA